MTQEVVLRFLLTVHMPTRMVQKSEHQIHIKKKYKFLSVQRSLSQISPVYIIRPKRIGYHDIMVMSTNALLTDAPFLDTSFLLVSSVKEVCPQPNPRTVNLFGI